MVGWWGKSDTQFWCDDRMRSGAWFGSRGALDCGLQHDVVLGRQHDHWLGDADLCLCKVVYDSEEGGTMFDGDGLDGGAIVRGS